MSITLTQAQTALQNWIDADVAASSNQQYTIGGRSITRVDALEIRNNINYWSGIIGKLERQANGQAGISVRLANFT